MRHVSDNLYAKSLTILHDITRNNMFYEIKISFIYNSPIIRDLVHSSHYENLEDGVKAIWRGFKFYGQAIFFALQ